jgi:hypothetical protein
MVTVTTISAAVLSALCSGQLAGSFEVATWYAGAGYSTASASMIAMLVSATFMRSSLQQCSLFKFHDRCRRHRCHCCSAAAAAAAAAAGKSGPIGSCNEVCEVDHGSYRGLNTC